MGFVICRVQLQTKAYEPNESVTVNDKNTIKW